MKKVLAILLAAAFVTGAGADNTLSNPGFETGVDPWTDWGYGSQMVLGSERHSGFYGLYAGQVPQGYGLEQTLAGTLGSQLLEVSFWGRGVNTPMTAALSLYAVEGTVSVGVPVTNDWTQIVLNVANLNPAWTFNKIRFWFTNYTGNADFVAADIVVDVPEPASAGLMG